MSLEPNDLARRGRAASFIVVGVLVLLAGSFFRSQILQHGTYALQSETNRLRELPLPAPRGVILDRRNRVIAGNVTGLSVSLLIANEDSLRRELERLSEVIPLTPEQVSRAIGRFRRAPTRPTLVIPSASEDEVSVLDEHLDEFPELVIQKVPRRFYPDGALVASFVGFTGEIDEAELAASPAGTYKSGQQVGKQGLEKAYEAQLRGKEGSQFVEMDERGHIVQDTDARQTLQPLAGQQLHTNIDLDLQRLIAGIFGDSLEGGAVAMDPNTGGVLALYSAPSWDANRFVGGVAGTYWDSLTHNPRLPLFNRAIQARFVPGATFNIATTAIALEANVVRMTDHMPIACTGGMQFGSRYYRCWDSRGHGSLDLAGAIAKSCDVYFYQLGLKLGLSRLVAGGIELGFGRASGIDLPEEARPRFPNSMEYFDRTYGARGWTNALVLGMAVGQGDNEQTVVNMARFYTAIATDGGAVAPHIAQAIPERTRILQLSSAQMQELREALGGGIVSDTSRGVAGGVRLAGKSATVPSAKVDPVSGRNIGHTWFVGFAPADKPAIVVAVLIEQGGRATRAAAIASRIIQAYLHVTTVMDPSTTQG